MIPANKMVTASLTVMSFLAGEIAKIQVLVFASSELKTEICLAILGCCTIEGPGITEHSHPSSCRGTRGKIISHIYLHGGSRNG